MKRHYHMKHAFTNLLLSYFIMLILPAIFIITLYNQAYDMAVVNSVEKSKLTLNQMQIVVDERIKALDNIVMQTISNMDMKGILTHPKPTPGDSSIYELSKINRNLDERFGGNPDIYVRYQLISLTSDIVYYNNAITYGYEFYYDFINVDNDNSMIQILNKHPLPTKRILLPTSKLRLDNSIHQVITYSFPIKYGNTEVPLGYLQFLIPEDALFIIPQGEGEKATFYLIDNNGTTLCSSILGNSFPLEHYSNTWNDFGYFHTMIDGVKSFIVYRTSEDTNMTVAAIYEEAVVLESASKIRFTALFAIFICLFVEIIMITWMSYRNATPIHNFAKNLRLLLSNNTSLDEGNKSEYDYLEEGIHTIKHSQNALNTMTEEKVRLQKKVFYDQLFEGRFKDNETIHSMANSMYLNLNAKEYYVTTFFHRYEHNLAETTIQEYLENNIDIPFIIHHFETGVLATIFMFQTDNTSENIDSLIMFIKQYLVKLDESCSSICIGIGNPCSHLSEITFAYRQAKYSSKLATKEEPIIVYENIVTKKHTPYYPQDLENRLVNATKFRESDKIKVIFIKLRQENFINRTLSNPMFLILISNLEATLFKVYHELLSEERADNIVNEISQMSNPEETMQKLESEFLYLSNRKEENRSSRNQQLCDAIKLFMVSNYTDPNLSLSSIAEYFNLSDSYFSQFYKDSFEESFSSSLENMRLEHGKKLIMNTQLEMEQICKMIGYNNSTTFRRAFKRVTGESPSSFKNSNDSNK